MNGPSRLAAVVLSRAGLLALVVVVGVVLVWLAPSTAGYVLVFWAAAAYAIRARRAPLSWERCARVGVLLVIAAGVTVPAVVGCVQVSWFVLEPVTGVQGSAHRSDLLLATLAVAGVLVLARRWPERLGERSFVVLSLALAVAVKIAYVNMVDAAPTSDFAEMWRLSSDLFEDGLEVTREGLPDSYVYWVYLERVLPYLLPLRAFFGLEESSYVIPNVFLGAATSFLTYALTRVWFGATAARLALVASLLAVETVLAAEIPTHDLPGAFYALLALVLGTAAWRLYAGGRDEDAVVAAFGFGVALVALDLQRSIGGVLLVVHTLLAPLLARESEEAPALRTRRFLVPLLLVLTPLVVYLAADRALRAAELRVPEHLSTRLRGLVAAAGTDSWGDASYHHSVNNYIVPYESVSLNWRRFVLLKLASDIQENPGGQAGGYLRKARRLYDLGSQTFFYLYEPRWHTGPVIDWVPRAQAVSRWFSALFLAALATASLRLWVQPRLSVLALFPLFYLAVLASLLLLAGEIQPRYMYPVWYVGAIYVGAWLAGGLNEKA